MRAHRFLAVVLASGCLWGCGGNVEAPGADGGYQDNSLVPADATATTDTLAATDSPIATDSHIATDSPVATDSPAGAPACGDGGSRMACGLINLPNTVTAMAINNTTNTLYAAMVAAPNANDVNGGIAVIDTTTNTVTSTMAPPTIAGGAIGPYFDHLMVADETNNLVYAARPAYCPTSACGAGAVEIIDVYDGATKAYKTSLDIAALDPNCSPSGSGLQWLAVDGARARLYVNCGLAQINGGIEIAVIATGATPSRAADIVLPDLPGYGFGAAALALDTTHQLLFANVQNLVDEVDTATNQEVAGSQQNVDGGGVVAMLGGAGYAALVTDEPMPDGGLPDGSTASTFFSLEPGKVTFTRPAASVVPAPMCPGMYIVIFDAELATFPIAAVQVSATEGIAPVVTRTSQRTVPVPPGTVGAGAGMAVGGNEHFYMYTYYAGTGFPYPFAGISVCDYP